MNEYHEGESHGTTRSPQPGHGGFDAARKRSSLQMAVMSGSIQEHLPLSHVYPIQRSGGASGGKIAQAVRPQRSSTANGVPARST